jgi:Leucine-rich repeat (LRR) protein
MKIKYILHFFLYVLIISGCKNEDRQEIVILDNNLSKIPDSVFSKKNLTVLLVSQEGFTIYPPLSALSDDLMPLKELPEQLGIFTDLKRLQISGTKIDHLPVSLTKLKRLDSLDLSRNPFLNIKDEIKKLEQLPQLKYLNLFGTQLDETDESRLRSIFRRAKLIFTLPEFLEEFEKLESKN